MSNKNAYEIRLELLMLAKEMLFEPVRSKRDAMYQEYYIQNEDSTVPRVPFPQLPDFPTIEEISKAAEDLYKFVDNKRE